MYEVKGIKTDLIANENSKEVWELRSFTHRCIGRGIFPLEI